MAALQKFMENVVWVWNWPFFIIIFHGVRFKPGRFALSDGKCFILEVIGFRSELLKGTFGVLKGGKIEMKASRRGEMKKTKNSHFRGLFLNE